MSGASNQGRDEETLTTFDDIPSLSHLTGPKRRKGFPNPSPLRNLSRAAFRGENEWQGAMSRAEADPAFPLRLARHFFVVSASHPQHRALFPGQSSPRLPCRALSCPVVPSS